MKRTCFLFLSFFNISLFLVSCKKETADNGSGSGADIVLEGSGFLCTIGVGRSGHSDTLTYYLRTGAGEEMVGYLKNAQVPEQHVSFEKRSNTTIAIKRTVPYHSVSKYLTYFGTQINPNPAISSFPNDYLFTHYETATEETEFIVKRSSTDIHKFTIESNNHPGNFLGVARWKNATYPTEANLVFTSDKREFFFMQQ